MIGLVHGLFFSPIGGRLDCISIFRKYFFSRTYEGGALRRTLHIVYLTPCIPPTPCLLRTATYWILPCEYPPPGHLPRVHSSGLIALCHLPLCCGSDIAPAFASCIHIIRKLIVPWQTLTWISLPRFLLIFLFLSYDMVGPFSRFIGSH
jgi:hypothetical protein